MSGDAKLTKVPQVRMDPDLHALMKAQASLRQVPLQALVEDACRAWLESGPTEKRSRSAKPVVADTPEAVAVKAQVARGIMRQAEAAVASWTPRDFSKSGQAGRGKGKKGEG